MSTIRIASKPLAELLVRVARERVENYEDDGLGDSPDCEDTLGVIEAIEEVAAFPAEVAVSGAEYQIFAMLTDLAEDALADGVDPSLTVADVRRCFDESSDA